MTIHSVLVCGAGTHREFGLRSLLDAGFRVGVVEDPANIDAAPADVWFRMSPAAALEARVFDDRFATEWEAAVCWGEFALDALPEALETTGLPGPRLDVTCVRNKPIMRQVLTAAGFPQPRYRVCHNLREVREFYFEIGRPIIVKPLDFAGSAGVRLVSNDVEIAAARADIELLTRSDVLCEEYLEGPEYSCELLLMENDASVVYGVTEKYVTPPPLFFELGHAFPAYVDSETRDSLISCAMNAARKLGVVTASVHVEIKLVAGQPYVIEVAGRLGGDEIPELVHLYTGVNPFLLEAKAVLGQHPDIAVATPRSSVRAVSLCLDGLPGDIVNLSGVRRLLSMRERFAALDIRLFISEETVLPDILEGRARVGQIVGTTDMNRAELNSFIRAIQAAL